MNTKALSHELHSNAIPHSLSDDRANGMVQDLLFTGAGVATLFALGKLIALATSGMPYGCWQSTAARAGASAAVVGTLVALRRGHLALFGAAYALVLLSTHASPLLLLSTLLAGAAAYLAYRLLRNKSLVARVVVVTLVFNLLLTLSGLVKAFGSTDGRTGLSDYASGTGLRVAATLAVALAVACIARLIASSPKA